MKRFIVVETEDGLTVVDVPEAETPEDAASTHGGRLADEETYGSYDDAYDAMIAIEQEEADADEPPN